MRVHSNADNLVGMRPPFNPATNAMAVSVGGEQSVISGHREFAIISWVKAAEVRRWVPLGLGRHGRPRVGSAGLGQVPLPDETDPINIVILSE